MVIAYPPNWAGIGQPVSIEQIEAVILGTVSGLDCNCIALSGGLDSALLFWFLLKTKRAIKAFTIGNSESHPDVEYSRLLVRGYNNVAHDVFVPSPKEIEEEQRDGDLPGDGAVRLFYKFVAQHTDSIMAGDGIDEFMCGYYDHQRNPGEKTYYDYLERLQSDQLAPLNSNSMGVNVLLPYLDSRLLSLLTRIPTRLKVDKGRRKILMMDLAKDKVPAAIIDRHKYGFCDAFRVKENINVGT